MLGNSVTMAQAGTVTVFSMSVVFATLILISFMIDLLKFVVEKINPVKKPKVAVVQPIIEIELPKEEENEEELIAVITAALAAQLGKRAEQLIVRSIVQVRNQEPAWAQVGRMELMK